MASEAVRSEATGPLKGVRVLDMTRVLSGPFASMMLADLGADVTKVESLSGDIMRSVARSSRGGVTGSYLNLNRGKRSISLDLREADAVEVVRRLAAKCDVLVENFRPATMASMGLGSDDLHRINPGLIFVSISGYGPDGPASDEPAYDSIIQARSGIAALQGSGKGDAQLVKSVVSDKIPAYMAVQSIAAALFARERGATGQVIDIPMFDTSLYYVWPDAGGPLTFVDGPDAGVPFRGLGLTDTADGQIAMHAMNTREHAVIDNALHISPDDEARAQRAAVLKAMRTDEALSLLRSHGVACSAVAELDEVLDDEHLRSIGAMGEWSHPRAGRVRQPRHPVRFGATPAEYRPFAPELGEHSRAILRELGYDDAEVDDLVRRGLVGGDAGPEPR